MNRRSFLQRSSAYAPNGAGPNAGTETGTIPRHNLPGMRESVASISSGDLTPYTPRPDKPWDTRRAAHLLRRAGFGPTWEEITAAVASTPAAVVDAMLADAPMPDPPPASNGDFPWYTDIHLSPDNSQLQQYYSAAATLQEWWTALMLQPSMMLREKMVLFWHNHFVSEYAKVLVTPFMLTQNQLFRQNALGSFKELTKQVTIDPAMLIYLDGTTSKAGNPNENYARELLELFTIGVGKYADGTAHYSEHDIVELARALTGWRVNSTTASEFKPASFDNGNKTILGATGNFGIQGKAAMDVIDLIFDQTDKDLGKKRAAVFVCSKLYQYFVYDTPDMDIVAGMAETMVANDWKIGPVLRQLLLSEHFMDDNVIGARIKSPVEFVLGSIRQLHLNAGITPTSRNNTDIGKQGLHDPLTAESYLAQTLLAPPNVKGWPGGRSWISSATVPLRIRYSQLWIDPISGQDGGYGFAPVPFVKSLPDAKTDVNKLLDHLLELMLPLAITDDARKPLLDALLAGGQTYEWDPDAANAGPRIKDCLIAIAGLGEYQLT
ncbi:MAG TPA: DUF1800 domain-containing protein [Candidatus Kapabacteria bacterium]|nr:DUF1800 domain-containing protein [Candidatus Kapabacteria bacterium]